MSRPYCSLCLSESRHQNVFSVLIVYIIVILCEEEQTVEELGHGDRGDFHMGIKMEIDTDFPVTGFDIDYRDVSRGPK